MITFFKKICIGAIAGLLVMTAVEAQTVALETLITGQPDINVTNNTFDVRKNLLMDIENSSGKKVFVWQEFDAGSTISKNVRCAVYTASMTLITSFILNTTTAGDQMSPVVRVNQQDNSFVVGWVSWIDNTNSSDPSKYDIYAKKIRFNNIASDALTNDLLINTNYSVGRQYAVNLAYDYTFNEIIIGWIDQDGQDRLPSVVANDNGSYARRVNNAASALALISGANQFQIITSATVSHQSLNGLEVSPVTGELYTFSFSYNFPAGSSCDMIFRKFTRGTGGNYVPGTESIINTYLTGIQYAGALTINSVTGDYVLGWTSDGQDGSGYGTYMKVYDKYSNLLKAETRINQTAYGNQIAPKALWHEASNNLVFYYWYSASGAADIRYQIFDGNNSYAYVSTEVVSTTKNLVDQFAGQFILRYDQATRRVSLSYDEFSAANTKGWYRQFIFTPVGLSVLDPQLNQNYIQTQTLLKNGVKQEAEVNGLSELFVKTERDYIDGLGRTIQQVKFNASPLKKDLVQPFVYDVYGREPKKYLPYVDASNDGSFKANVIANQAAFYSANGDRVANDANPFSINVFEASSLDRLVKIYPEGAAWQTGVDHSMRFSWRTNIANEVKNWIYDFTTESASGTSYYAVGSLYVKDTTNEDGNRIWEYRDKIDRVVLRKEENITNGEFLETYYVYDDFGKLRFVIPPMKASITNFSYTSTDAIQYFFCYRYDDRQRMVMKKIPGADSLLLVYDQYDRVILTQDGNQRNFNKWSYTKYDVLNRIVMTGIYTHSGFILRTNMQILANGQISPLNENRQASSIHGYSNYVWPTINCEPLVVNYYDDYDFDYNGSVDYAYIPQGLLEEGSVKTYAKGLLTGTKVKILNTSDWLKSVIFYDKNKRAIQTQKNNHKNIASLSDITTTVYNFSGNIILNKQSHSIGSTPLTVIVKQDYDHMNRPTRTRHQVNSNAEITLVELKYNELGQVVEKNLHSENNGINFLQSLDYTYNIQGWLNNINNSNLNNDGVLNNDANDLFGMQFFYENAVDIGNTPRYNGNITGISWKSANTNTSTNQRAYRYIYDGLGRLIEGKFADKPSTTWNFEGKMDERSITYDKNGNITTLLRTDNSAATLDNFSYTYTGNRLTNLQRVGGASYSYNYDANGNVISDGQKGMSFSYNHLNLVSNVMMNTTGLSFTYSASGEKLKKVWSIPSPTSPTTEYIGAFLYKDGVLQQFSTQEGRVELLGSAFTYVYNIKDQLGNVRMSFDKTPTTGVARIIQEDHYYPFGLLQSYSGFSYRFGNVNKFLYNGKDLQDEGGLNWYDYGARMYDGQLGRWHSVDPLAEKYYKLSPYNYVANNPIIYIDPDGRKLVFATGVSDLFKQQFAEAIGYLNQNGAGGMLAQLEAIEEVYTIQYTERPSYFDPNTKTIYWNPTGGVVTNNGVLLSPSSALNHEADHGLQEAKDPKQREIDTNTKDLQYKNKEEKRVITGSEQDTAKKLGEIKDGEVTRTDHEGIPYTTTGPTTTKDANEVEVIGTKKESEIEQIK